MDELSNLIHCTLYMYIDVDMYCIYFVYTCFNLINITWHYWHMHVLVLALHLKIRCIHPRLPSTYKAYLRCTCIPQCFTIHVHAVLFISDIMPYLSLIHKSYNDTIMILWMSILCTCIIMDISSEMNY